MCSFIDNVQLEKKKKETTATKVVIEFNASHITRNTSANVGESYGIFTFRFSTWAIFDTQLANEFLFESMFFLIVQYLRSKFTSQRITKVSFLLKKFARPFEWVKSYKLR